MRICAPWSVSSPRGVLGAWRCSDGSFEYQFLIDNTVYRYFKFTLSTMAIILQCRYFVSVLACDARYCKAQFCGNAATATAAVLQSHVVRACVRPSIRDVRGSGPHRL